MLSKNKQLQVCVVRLTWAAAASYVMSDNRDEGPVWCARQRTFTRERYWWVHWIFLRGCLPSLSINYAAMSKDMGKRLPRLYYIKMKISYDLGFIAIGVAIAT